MTYPGSCTASIGVLAMMLAGAPAAAQSTAPAQPAASRPEAAEPAPDGANAQTTSDAPPPTDDDIIVTGFRGSLQKAIDLKRTAVGVRDSIVAEDIGKFPEQNVADSLQRIPGVFLSRDGASNEGQRISIRGLGSQYSVTTINGAPVRTTSSSNVGSSTRDFNFDVFPSELFGRVDIYKTPLANLEEGGIGGNIDLQTPRPFDSSGRVIRYSGAANYNTQSHTWNPRGSLLVSDTRGNFGALFGLAFARNTNERSGFQSTGGYNSSVLGALNYQAGVPASTPKGTFGFRLDSGNPLANLGGLTRAQVDNALLPRFFRDYASSNTRQRLGMVGSLQYKSDRLEISLDGIYANLRDSTDEFTFGVAVRNSRTDPGTTSLPGRGTNSGLIPIDVKIDSYNNLYGTFANASFLGESFFRDSETRFRYLILRGVYDITDRLKLSAQANASDSNARYSANRIVDNVYAVRSTFDPTVNVTYPTITSSVDVTNPRNFADPSLGFQLNREIDRQKTARGQLDWDGGDWAGIDWSAIAGGSYVATTKQVSLQDGSAIASRRTLPDGRTFGSIDVFSYMNPYVQIGTLDNGGNAGFLSQFATFPRWFVMDYLGANSANSAATPNLNAAFRAEEIVASAFFEANAKTEIGGHALRGNVGLRYADTTTRINNYTSAGGGFTPAFRQGGYGNLLPSMSLAFDITPKLLIRGSAGKTITRAALSIIAGNTTVPNPFNPNITVGNPNLKPQVATQFDGSLEWYFATGGLLSVGAFKKRLDGTATAVQDTTTLGESGLPSSAFDARSILGDPNGVIPASFVLQRTRYINQGTLRVKGLEFAYQQAFRFLPAPFDGLGAIASYTRIQTAGATFVTNGSRNVDVQLFPKSSYSLTGYYEKGRIALRGSYNYRARQANSSANNGNNEISYTAATGYLDATASYRLSDAVELRLDGLNLTNVNSYTYYEDPDQKAGNGLSRRDNSYFNGRTIAIGIRGKF